MSIRSLTAEDPDSGLVHIASDRYPILSITFWANRDAPLPSVELEMDSTEYNDIKIILTNFPHQHRNIRFLFELRYWRGFSWRTGIGPELPVSNAAFFWANGGDSTSGAFGVGGRYVGTRSDGVHNAIVRIDKPRSLGGRRDREDGGEAEKDVDRLVATAANDTVGGGDIGFTYPPGPTPSVMAPTSFGHWLIPWVIEMDDALGAYPPSGNVSIWDVKGDVTYECSREEKLQRKSYYLGPSVNILGSQI
ncbi:hypothetical protein B0H13DRAFT_1882152 [Mycena leptocephala]|nr:hypothetical protein B0H13DRAFT_1882152 [Mycena leptocephala]